MRKHSGQSGRLDREGGIVSRCVFVLAPACSVHQMNDKRRWGAEEGAGGLPVYEGAGVVFLSQVPILAIVGSRQTRILENAVGRRRRSSLVA